MGSPSGHRPSERQAVSRPSRFAPRLADVGQLTVALVVTTLADLASGTLKSMAGEIAPIWLGNAVLLSRLMVAPRGRKYWILAGGLLGNLAAALLTGKGLRAAAIFTSADIVEVLTALAFSPRVSSISDLLRPATAARFVVGGVLLAPAVSGVFAIPLLGERLSEYTLPSLAKWFVSDAFSLAIFVPAALVFWTGEIAHIWRADQRRKTAFLLLLVCIVTAGVFGQNRYPLLYWTFPPIVLLAFQAEVAGMMVGLLLCLAIALYFTLQGSGPLWVFPYETMQNRILALQLFLVAVLGIALPVSATQAQRNRLFAMLRDGERRYRVLAENATDIVMSLDLEGRLTYISPRVTTLLGHAPDCVIGTLFAQLAASNDRAALAAAIANAAASDVETSRVSRFLRADGDALWMETHLRRVIDPLSGKPDSLTATVRDITERKLAEQRHAEERAKLHSLAFRDGLTGLFNRRHFDRALGRRWRLEARADRRGFLAVIMADVDSYKSYNDHYGHQRGDECLSAIAQAIASSATRVTDTVARYGGEEFALILSDTDQEGAFVVAERIRQAVENLRIPHEACSAGIITLSLGVAALQTRDGGDPTALVHAADRALYAAKRQGRNRTCVGLASDTEPTMMASR